MGQGYAWAHPAPPVQVATFMAHRVDGARTQLATAPLAAHEPACEGLPAVMATGAAASVRRPRTGRGRPAISGARSRRSAGGTGRG
jgi:hypothetical protein